MRFSQNYIFKVGGHSSSFNFEPIHLILFLFSLLHKNLAKYVGFFRNMQIYFFYTTLSDKILVKKCTISFKSMPFFEKCIFRKNSTYFARFWTTDTKSFWFYVLANPGPSYRAHRKTTGCRGAPQKWLSGRHFCKKMFKKILSYTLIVV